MTARSTADKPGATSKKKWPLPLGRIRREETLRIPAKIRARGKPAFWIPCVNVSLVILLGATILTLLAFYLPFIAGSAVLVGLLAALWKQVNKFIKLNLFSSFFQELTAHVADLLRQLRTILVLGGLAAITIPSAVWNWYINTQCPVLRIEPGSYLAYLLGGPGEERDKPPAKTFEILVSRHSQGTREWTEFGRFSLQYAGALVIGAPEGYLRWRAAIDAPEEYLRWRAAIEEKKEDADEESKAEKGKQWFFGTSQFHAGDEVRISFRCRSTKAPLFEPVEITIGPDLVTEVSLEPYPKDEDRGYFNAVANCRPLGTD